ncbi:hypothetical protein TNCV_2960211 [Trichonephila clavipes]|nr:hypothetical protein TNCV_2960211 [Trichonephila clavipes]
MEMNGYTASSMQLAARWSTAAGVLMSASSICRHLLRHRLRARVPLFRIPLTANYRQLERRTFAAHTSNTDSLPQADI